MLFSFTLKGWESVTRGKRIFCGAKCSAKKVLRKGLYIYKSKFNHKQICICISSCPQNYWFPESPVQYLFSQLLNVQKVNQNDLRIFVYFFMFPSPTGKVLIDKKGVTGILTKSYDVMLDSSGEPDSLPGRSLQGPGHYTAGTTPRPLRRRGG